MPDSATETAILLISAPDQRGLVAGVAELLYRHQANILHADQHIDAESNQFFMRVEWGLDGFELEIEAFRRLFQPLADRMRMQWRLELSALPQRVAIFVSRYDHCLVDLLYRQRSGELNCTIPLVISNHPDTADLANFYGTRFEVTPVSADTKAEAEQRQLELLREQRIDLVVLARYMQVLTPRLLEHFPSRIINIHHSFLPAFLGARPYHRAHERGVKLIGATAHYVTEVLDEGPIIEQDVARVSHRNQVEDLVQKGRDLEKVVLSRAVRWHCEHRILTYGNKTVVFD